MSRQLMVSSIVSILLMALVPLLAASQTANASEAVHSSLIANQVVFAR